MISKKDVEYAANLSRINLDDKELSKLTKQLEGILALVNKLNEVDISDVEPMSHVLELNNVFREDKVKPSLPLSEVIKKTEIREGNFFKVPKVIE